MAVRVSESARLWFKVGRVDLPSPKRAVAGRVRKSKPPRANGEEARERAALYVERGGKFLTGDWPEGATLDGGDAKDVVGAWAWFHRGIYGVVPLEVEAEWDAVHAAAKRVFVDYLKGEFDDALDFLRWVAAKARDDFNAGKTERRMRWRYIFNASTVTDWKVARGFE
jgi:hypothetical protein